MHVLTVDPERSVEEVQGAVRDPDRIVRLCQMLANHNELVAARSANGVGSARRFEQSVSNRYQHTVATPVTSRVVEHFETVQVDEQHGDQILPTFRAPQAVLEAVDKKHSVWQTREGIVKGFMFEQQLGCLAGADVRGGSVYADDFALITAYRVQALVDPKLGPILA